MRWGFTSGSCGLTFEVSAGQGRYRPCRGAQTWPAVGRPLDRRVCTSEPSSFGDSLLPEDENRLEWIRVQRVKILLVSGDEPDKLLSGAVADAHPDELGRMVVQQAALMKVGILRDEGRAVGRCILPYILVGLTEQAALANACAAGKKRRQQAGQLGREVLIK